MAKNWMEKTQDQRIRENNKNAKAYDLLVSILNKHGITEGISSFNDCSKWSITDQRIFIKGMMGSGYTEETLYRLYKFSILKK